MSSASPASSADSRTDTTIILAANTTDSDDLRHRVDVLKTYMTYDQFKLIIRFCNYSNNIEKYPEVWKKDGEYKDLKRAAKGVIKDAESRERLHLKNKNRGLVKSNSNEDRSSIISNSAEDSKELYYSNSLNDYSSYKPSYSRSASADPKFGTIKDNMLSKKYNTHAVRINGVNRTSSLDLKNSLERYFENKEKRKSTIVKNDDIISEEKIKERLSTKQGPRTILSEEGSRIILAEVKKGKDKDSNKKCRKKRLFSKEEVNMPPKAKEILICKERDKVKPLPKAGFYKKLLSLFK